VIVHIYSRDHYKIQSILLELRVSKGAGLGGIPSLILKNCAFARPLSLLFTRSLSTCVFPDRWKLSFYKRTPIFKKGRRINVKDYLGVAILSAILKRFELLVYRTMYDVLKNLISVNQNMNRSC
jgi:hypothetical protein